MKQIYILAIISLLNLNSLIAQTALDFDSSSGDQQVEILGITCPDEFTFEAWINHRGQADIFPTILEFGNDIPFFGLENDFLTLYDIIFSTSTIPLNEWVHVAVTFSTVNSEANLYINGVLDATETGVTLDISGAGAGIGYNGSDGAFNGSIDDLRIWNVVRSENEIFTNINICLNGSEIGLYAFYNFNEGSGTVVNDLTNNNFNGTLLNMDSATDWIAYNDCSALSIEENALNFDGINDYVSIPDQNSLDLLANDDMSIEFWFNTSSTSSYMPILVKTDQTNNQVGYAVSMYSGIIGIAKIGDGTGLTLAQINTSSTFNDGNWHHFTAVMPGIDASNYLIYIDETLQETTILGNNFAGEMINSIDLRIGTDLSFNSFFQGTIDEIRIWEKSLSASEIASLSNSELVGNEIDLIAYYKFNQGIANGNNATEITLNDLTSNNSNGTLNDFALNGTASNWVGGVEFSTLSIHNNVFNSNISLFPNPSIQFIQISGLTENNKYTIYDILGTKIKKGVVSNNEQIDIRNFTNGLYFLKFKNGNTIKFIKE
jgi:hypothetical protein